MLRWQARADCASFDDYQWFDNTNAENQDIHLSLSPILACKYGLWELQMCGDGPLFLCIPL